MLACILGFLAHMKACVLAYAVGHRKIHTPHIEPSLMLWWTHFVMKLSKILTRWSLTSLWAEKVLDPPYLYLILWVNEKTTKYLKLALKMFACLSLHLRLSALYACSASQINITFKTELVCFLNKFKNILLAQPIVTGSIFI